MHLKGFDDFRKYVIMLKELLGKKFVLVLAE